MEQGGRHCLPALPPQSIHTIARAEAVAVLCLGVASVITGYPGRTLPTPRKSIQRIGARLSGRLQEKLTGMRTVQAFQHERHDLTRLDEANCGIRQVEVPQGKPEAYRIPQKMLT